MRKKRPVDRSANLSRDATLVVIASEDRFAVKQYFELFRSTRVQFRVLETDHGESSPAHVLSRLTEYMKEFDFGDGDKFWLVCDTDHWIEPNHIKNLVEVVRLCNQKGIEVAVSNPCFDIWLLLHFREYPTEQNLSCDAVGQMIRDELGEYNKTKVFNLPIDNERVAAAITRASAQTFTGPIPETLYTSVYKIVEDLFRNRKIKIGS